MIDEQISTDWSFSWPLISCLQLTANVKRHLLINITLRLWRRQRCSSISIRGWKLSTRRVWSGWTWDECVTCLSWWSDDDQGTFRYEGGVDVLFLIFVVWNFDNQRAITVFDCMGSVETLNGSHCRFPFWVFNRGASLLNTIGASN